MGRCPGIRAGVKNVGTGRVSEHGWGAGQEQITGGQAGANNQAGIKTMDPLLEDHYPMLCYLPVDPPSTIGLNWPFNNLLFTLFLNNDCVRIPRP